MKTKKVENRTNLQSVETYEGEPLEKKLERIINNNEPIKDGAPIIYTEKKDGVLPAFNIRTDRWDIALEATDKIHRAKIAKSEGKSEEKSNEKPDGKSDAKSNKPEPAA